MEKILEVNKNNQLNVLSILIEEDAGYISSQRNEGLIREMNERSIDFTQPIYVYATLQKYGDKNRNGRVYPKDILMREVTRYMEIVKRNASFHELDHPDSSIISLKGGSPHRIVDMWWEGNILIGKLEILVSRGYRESGIISCDGDLVAHYLSYGMTLGISSRGIGSLKKVNGENVVQDDFELICWDIVSSPSVPGSYLYDRPEDYKKYDEDLKDEPQNLTNSNKKDKFDDVFNRFLNFKK